MSVTVGCYDVPSFIPSYKVGAQGSRSRSRKGTDYVVFRSFVPSGLLRTLSPIRVPRLGKSSLSSTFVFTLMGRVRDMFHQQRQQQQQQQIRQRKRMSRRILFGEFKSRQILYKYRTIII